MSNTNTLVRGVIYVTRNFNGRPFDIKLSHQWQYAEWAGCFSGI